MIENRRLPDTPSVKKRPEPENIARRSRKRNPKRRLARSKPGAPPELPVLIAKRSFQYRRLAPRSNRLDRNKRQEYQKIFGMQKEEANPRNHDAPENINRIPYPRI